MTSSPANAHAFRSDGDIHTHSTNASFALEDVFALPKDTEVQRAVQTDVFERSQWSTPGHADYILDRFPGAAGASCCFLRLRPRDAATVRFELQGVYGFASCASGGWLLTPVDRTLPTYWIPQAPVLRAYDAHDRILHEEPAPLAAFRPSTAVSTVEIEMRGDSFLECAIWRLSSEASDIVESLEQPLVLEQQPLFMLSSHAAFRGPADIYVSLFHGRVYENRFDFRHKRKICSELEAYAVYVSLHGLEAASGKRLYGLLKHQIVYSVIARQAPDGAWYHGEWTDLMESHFRFQTGAMLLLEAALEERSSEVVRNALRKAAAYLASQADPTDIGLWFPHDSLEQSAEQMDQAHPRWIASRELGKSPANKMILNTHLDAIVALSRYRTVTDDNQYAESVASALQATRTLLALRPAEWLYRSLYWAVGLTLLPVSEAQRLPVALRAVKRVTREHLIPHLHRVKRRFPRVVMPGGLIERHLSRLHFGVNYHSVNVADLVRVWRCFPQEDFARVVSGAITAVTETSLLTYWIEGRQRQALGYWVEALYHVCTLRQEFVYRRHLADAMIHALDAGLGLPPSLLGSHPEVVKPADRIPCPSPSDARLRVANLYCSGRQEIVVVNPSQTDISTEWEHSLRRPLSWTSSDERALAGPDGPPTVPARGWVLGREN